jgi:plastocyanin
MDQVLSSRSMRTAVVFVLFAAACEAGGGNTAVDAAPDVAIAPVVTLDDCPAFVAAMIEDSPTMFIPKETTINKGQSVKFVITSEHFVLPNTLTTTDPALNVKRGETKCFKFNTVGTYGFLCGVHGFTGTITVQ